MRDSQPAANPETWKFEWSEGWSEGIDPDPPWRQPSGVLRAWRLPLVEAIISSIRKRRSGCVTWRPVLKQVLPWPSLNSAAEIDPYPPSVAQRFRNAPIPSRGLFEAFFF